MRIVTISSPQKVYFQTNERTKLDLVRYYLAVGDAVMRQMFDRPVMLQRFPNGRILEEISLTAAGRDVLDWRIDAGQLAALSTAV